MGGSGGVLLIVAIALQTGDLLPSPRLKHWQRCVLTSNKTLTSGHKAIGIILYFKRKYLETYD